MAKILVSRLKPGVCLSEDVHTPLGGLLFHKGTTLGQRELQILSAFFIKRVTVDSNVEDDVLKPEDEKQIEWLPPIYEEYYKLYTLIKKAFPIARNKMTGFPIEAIKEQLIELLKHINNYDVMSFRRPSMKTVNYYYHNSILVSLTSFKLALWAGFSKNDLLPIALAGLLHDIGNERIDRNILHKESSLTDEERKKVQKHTIEGFHLLKQVPDLKEGIKLVALQHHEKNDGSGYPLGVSSKKIHPYAKVVAVADIFHAMTSNRTYKHAESPYLVMEQLIRESHKKLEPTLIQKFIQNVSKIRLGSKIKLNDGTFGEVISVNHNHPTRPVVMVAGEPVSLVKNSDLYIEEVYEHKDGY